MHARNISDARHGESYDLHVSRITDDLLHEFLKPHTIRIVVGQGQEWLIPIEGVALPGDQDLVVGIAAAQAVGQAVPLLFGVVVCAGAQDVADPVEQVAGVAAQGVLLDPAADLVHRLAGELDDAERVQHRGGLAHLVTDRVGIPTERVQDGDLDLVAEARRATFTAAGSPREAAARLCGCGSVVSTRLGSDIRGSGIG